MRNEPKIHNVKAVRVSVLIGLLTFSFFVPLTLPAADDSPTFSPQPDPVNWIVGPAKADLGNFGEIRIPDGYRFAGGEEARTLLKIMSNPAPNALVGIVAPISGSYMVVLEFTRVGYVKDTKDSFDSAVILNSLRKKVDHQNAEAIKQGTVSITSVDWEQEPQHDLASHVMEWAIRAQTGSDKTINHVVRIFGREGLLDGIAVQSGASAEAIPLRQLMSGISFKPGRAYSDFRAGDRVSSQSLAQLITTDESDTKADSRLTTYAVGGAVVLIIGITGVVVLKRKPGHPVKRENQTMATALSQKNGSAPKFLNGVVARENPVNGNGHLNGHANGKLNGHNKLRRRKLFDYQKYYTDLMFQVSDRAYEVEKPAPDQKVSNPSKPANPSEGNHNYNAHSANVSLIEGQKRLIEEQQRLIREQTKLIEEKTRLIQEKNNVLDKQSELFGNNVF
jgi:uncharacterized membrane-anchored protein